MFNIANNGLLKHVGEEDNKSKSIANAILAKAIKVPLIQILDNAGFKVTKTYNTAMETGYVYDVKNEKYGDLLKLGVIDPMKVTKNALQNAVSVEVTILSTNAIITMARSYEKSEE